MFFTSLFFFDHQLDKLAIAFWQKSVTQILLSAILRSSDQNGRTVSSLALE
jgi:hypothetical protein